jgi:hypothetical protein
MYMDEEPEKAASKRFYWWSLELVAVLSLWQRCGRIMRPTGEMNEERTAFSCITRRGSSA